MRKLKACIHIQAPVQRVRLLAERDREEWLLTRRGILLHTLAESWEATALDCGSTRFTLQMAYKARVPFLEPFVADGFQQQVSYSLNRLKQLAEAIHPPEAM